jgi:hypothetical protein
MHAGFACGVAQGPHEPPTTQWRSARTTNSDRTTARGVQASIKRRPCCHQPRLSPCCSGRVQFARAPYSYFQPKKSPATLPFTGRPLQSYSEVSPLGSKGDLLPVVNSETWCLCERAPGKMIRRPSETFGRCVAWALQLSSSEHASMRADKWSPLREKNVVLAVRSHVLTRRRLLGLWMIPGDNGAVNAGWSPLCNGARPFGHGLRWPVPRKAGCARAASHTYKLWAD